MPRQSRTANPVNEISGITNAVGPAWAQPAYDPAGNMTTIPKPKDPTKEFTATYDAWNRLTKLEEDDGAEGLQTVAEYQYDARRFRIVQKNYEEGALTETRHHYYNTVWQNLEERLGTTPDMANADRQFVWGQRYIDDCLLRDRDSNADGSLDERLYAMQDANWNVTALADPILDIQGRLVYSAYGAPSLLTPFFNDALTSFFDWQIAYSGYLYDAHTALYSVRHRYFSWRLGAWTSFDPIGYDSGPHLFEYTRSSPLRFVDPFGLKERVRQFDCEGDNCFYVLTFNEKVSSDVWNSTMLAGHTAIGLSPGGTFYGFHGEGYKRDLYPKGSPTGPWAQGTADGFMITDPIHSLLQCCGLSDSDMVKLRGRLDRMRVSARLGLDKDYSGQAYPPVPVLADYGQRLRHPLPWCSGAVAGAIADLGRCGNGNLGDTTRTPRTINYRSGKTPLRLVDELRSAGCKRASSPYEFAQSRSAGYGLTLGIRTSKEGNEIFVRKTKIKDQSEASRQYWQEWQLYSGDPKWRFEN